MNIVSEYKLFTSLNDTITKFTFHLYGKSKILAKLVHNFGIMIYTYFDLVLLGVRYYFNMLPPNP
jgi:hypothetical protein